MELFSKLSTEEKLLKLRDTIGTVDEHEYILNNIISVYASTKNFQHVLPHCTLLLLENEEIRERVISFLVDNKIGEEYLTALVCSKYYVHRLCVIQLMKGCNLHKKELYNILINDEIQFVCCKALKTIPKDLYSDEELYNIIKNLFENKSDYIRCAAVYLLPHLNDINILEEIIEFILHNDSWRIKYNFSIIFHKLSKPCIKKYYKLLVECNDEYIRAEALKSLSYFLELEDRDRIIEIIKDLLTDKIDEVRTNCVKEIGVFLEKMFDENIFIMFLKFSKNDSCLEVKKEMVKIFINIFKNKNIKLCYIN
ncbi:Protein phosphatase regulatory subunit A, partial [Spraguea lophii 42_110]